MSLRLPITVDDGGMLLPVRNAYRSIHHKSKTASLWRRSSVLLFIDSPELLHIQILSGTSLDRPLHRSWQWLPFLHKNNMSFGHRSLRRRQGVARFHATPDLPYVATVRQIASSFFFFTAPSASSIMTAEFALPRLTITASFIAGFPIRCCSYLAGCELWPESKMSISSARPPYFQ